MVRDGGDGGEWLRFSVVVGCEEVCDGLKHGDIAAIDGVAIGTSGGADFGTDVGWEVVHSEVDAGIVDREDAGYVVGDAVLRAEKGLGEPIPKFCRIWVKFEEMG